MRGGASSGKVIGGSKLRNVIGVSQLRTGVEEGHAPCRGIYCTLEEKKNGVSVPPPASTAEFFSGFV
ncbi:hypothetical protein TNCT_391981 [Trichonephila clavata]|uniref:Uncharacterized protein n=1 Tax=Trichonephila clavata TaxID=2740835 RepID=A0A8X6J2V2_TRICU|nr:hypothetical protein TNCT_391981 [Trichonephila clavata]